MKKKIDENEAQKELEKGFDDAKKILNNSDKLEEFLEKLEIKIKDIPIAGNTLSMIPTMISLVKNYANKKYTDVPVRTIIAIISALLYWLSPADLILDAIPGIGYIDDAAVIKACLKSVQKDLDDFKKWRIENKY